MPMWPWLKCKRPPPDQEIEEEIASHLAMLAEEQREQGSDAPTAAASARRKLGNRTLILEDTRNSWRHAWLEEVKRDLQFTLRMFGRARLFCALVIVILALGITTTVSFFSLIDGVLLRPLPYRDPSSLVALTSYTSKPPYDSNGSVSYRDYQVIASKASSIAELGITYRSGWSRVILLDEGDPLPLQGAFVSPSLFSLFGGAPLLGRTFTSEENTRAEHLVVISESLWAGHFASSPSVLGKSFISVAAFGKSSASCRTIFKSHFSKRRSGRHCSHIPNGTTVRLAIQSVNGVGTCLPV
jgi:MacB-like periplasmic core domain